MCVQFQISPQSIDNSSEIRISNCMRRPEDMKIKYRKTKDQEGSYEN